MPNVLARSASFQSTLPVGGATCGNYTGAKAVQISIHAPRGGSDVSDMPDTPIGVLFQSTLPVGGATRIEVDGQVTLIISIHAPRGGSDYMSKAAIEAHERFQSTLPVGGATGLFPA